MSDSVLPRIPVWDIPTRLFHWLLVLLFAFSWWSAESRAMDWHRSSGLAILALVLFRLIWGVIGGSTARFAFFVRAPADVIAYVRAKDQEPRIGHNPLGGYSVIAMLTLLVVEVSAGLFAVDVDGIESGPLSFLVSFEQGRAASEIHEIAFNVMLALIGLHLLAIAFYEIVRGQRLILAMLTGLGRPGDGKALKRAGAIRFLVAAAAACGIAWWVSIGLGQ